MRLELFVAVGLIAVSSWAVPGYAEERPGPVAIGSLKTPAEAGAPELANRWRASLHGGLSAVGFEVVEDANVEAAKRANGLVGCDTTQCMRRVGELVTVPLVIRAVVGVQGSSDFVLLVELIDISTGGTIATSKENCSACTLAEANEALSNQAGQIKIELEKYRASSVAAERPRRFLEIRHERLSSPTRWTLRGLGAGFLAFGIVGIAEGVVEKNNNGEGVDANGKSGCSPCQYHLDTSKAATGFLAAGIVSAALGVGLSVAGWWRWKPRIELVPQASANSFRLSMSGRF